MTSDVFMDVVKQGIFILLTVITPVMVLSLLVGLTISVFQAVTQINEQTLTFVPKILVVFLTLAVTGGWIMQKMVEYAQMLWTQYLAMI
ncbi:flagellar biosynthesis protein FliQ [Mesoaciditoga sp.]